MRPSFAWTQRNGHGEAQPSHFGFRERARAGGQHIRRMISSYSNNNQERHHCPPFSSPRYHSSEASFSRTSAATSPSNMPTTFHDTSLVSMYSPGHISRAIDQTYGTPGGRRTGQRNNFHDDVMGDEFSRNDDDVVQYVFHSPQQTGGFPSAVQTYPGALSSSSSSSSSSHHVHLNGMTANGASTTSPVSSFSTSRGLDLRLNASNKNSRMSGEDDRKGNTATAATTTTTKVEYKKDGKPEECCICQEMLLSDLVALVPCGHVMHGVCAKQCVQHGRKCPQCRAKMNLRDPFVKLYLDVSSYASSSASDVVLVNRLKSMETLLEARQKDLTAAEDKYQFMLKEHHLDVIEKERCVAELKEMHDKYSSNIKSEHKVRMEMKAMEDAYQVVVKDKEDAVQAKVNLEKKIHYLEVALDIKDGEVNRLRKQLEEQMRKNQSIESLREKRASQDKLILELGEKLRLQLVENNQLRARLASNTNSSNHESAARGEGGFDMYKNHRQQQKLHDFNTFRKRTYGETNHDYSVSSSTAVGDRMENNHHWASVEARFYHNEEASFEMTKRMSTPSSSSSTAAFSETGAAKRLKFVPGTMKIALAQLQQPRPGMQLTMKQMFSKRN